MDKNGFLLAEETLKIIIALISISFLVFFLTSLYFNNINEKKLQQAQSILKSSDQSIKNIIANIKDGESVKRELPNPSGWYLFGFTEEKPNSCLGGDCICICDKSLNPFNTFAEDCSDEGICLVVNSLEPFEEIEIKSPKTGFTNITISKDQGKISINEKS